jgi:hypothetical protein
MPFYKYRTDQNNTITAVSGSSFTGLAGNEAQVSSSVVVPQAQPLYLYRVSGGTVIDNTNTNVDHYLNNVFSYDNSPSITTRTFTGYTATTNTRIGNVETIYITGATNVGSGNGLYASTSNHKLQLKSLIAGANVTLVPTSTGITISSSGGGGYTVATTTIATYNETTTSGSKKILANALSNNININLPTAIANTAEITIKKIDATNNTVTITAFGSEKIDGLSTQVIKFKNTSITIFSDELNWYIE